MTQHIRQKATALVITAALSISFTQSAIAKDRYTITADNHALQVSCSQDFNDNGQPTVSFLRRLDAFVHEVKNIPSHNYAPAAPSYVLMRQIRSHGGGGMLDGITDRCKATPS